MPGRWLVLLSMLMAGSPASASNLPCSLHGGCCFITWESIRNAEWIVVATGAAPGEGGETPVGGVSRSEDEAGVRVNECWKGDLATAPSWLRPTHQPPRDGHHRGAVYLVTAGGSWTRCSPYMGLDSVRDVVDTALRLQRLPLTDDELRLEWQLELASGETTRWRGLPGLAHLASQQGGLSRAHASRLVDGIVRHELSWSELRTLLWLLDDHPSTKLDEALVERLEARLEEGRVRSGTKELFTAILRRAGDPHAESRLQELGWPIPVEELRRVWAEACTDLGLEAPD